MLRNDLGPIRRLGRVGVTRSVKKSLPGQNVLNALLLHIRGGNAVSESQPASDNLRRCRTLNVCRNSTSQSFWTTTQADRTVTTALMPEEF